MRLPASLAFVAVLLAATPTVRAQQPATIPVTVVVAAKRPVTGSSEFVGRVEAVERVDIRARITGFIKSVDFKEGDVVQEGKVLYRIEPDTFEAAVQQARGDLLKAQAEFANATAQRARTQELVKTSAAAVATLDERIAAEKTAQGHVVIADANLKSATVNLGYTEIVAPITGEVGRSALTRGNVVSPDSGVLVTIVSRDPMYVTFPVSQKEFLTVEREAARSQAGDAMKVKIRFSDGSLYGETGKINFIDTKVNRETDSVLVRATMANPKGLLIDGQLVRVLVEANKPEEKVVVPQSALILDQQGVYVFAVQDGKAVVKRIKIGADIGADVVVEDGLQGGEQIVVQGMESLRPGTAVIANPAPAAAPAQPTTRG